MVNVYWQSFSSIVGPNGSGKSNVIDSMLFVFGYRAAKIRSKKISVLIHSSDDHKDINSCTVSVHFQKIIDRPVSHSFNQYDHILCIDVLQCINYYSVLKQYSLGIASRGQVAETSHKVSRYQN